MKNWLLTLLVLPLFLSVSSLSAQDSLGENVPDEEYEVDGPMAYGIRCAVFYGPTDMELENLYASIDAIDIDSWEEESEGGDESIQGREWLASRKIKSYESDADVLYFRKANGKLLSISRKKLKGTSGVIFFDPRKDPIQVSPKDISEEGGIYFGIEQ